MCIIPQRFHLTANVRLTPPRSEAASERGVSSPSGGGPVSGRGLAPYNLPQCAI